LTEAHLEKLILLFDIFEAINGSRDGYTNKKWLEALRNLTPEYIEHLRNKHKIEPMSSTPWIKGKTGGSDDHAAIFIGKTFTEAEATNPSGFIKELKERRTNPAGRHNDYKGLAFALYKIAYDFSHSKATKDSSSLLAKITGFIFEEKPFDISTGLKINKIKHFDKKKTGTITGHLIGLIDALKNSPEDIEEKLEIVYTKISAIADSFFSSLLRSLEKDLAIGDIESVIKNISSSIPGIFLSMPFFTTLSNMYRCRSVINNFSATISGGRQKPKRILWFTDTINDLNGVSVTLKNMCWAAHACGADIKAAACIDPADKAADIPPNVINLPTMYSFAMPYYENVVIKFPSALESLRLIYDYEPDEIYVSTPGPVGIFGLLAAKMLGLKSTGIYHTDFAEQANHIIKDESAVSLIDSYAKWFYGMIDLIKVPTKEYIKILEQRGYDNRKMSVFRRGIDSSLFSPRAGGRTVIKEYFGIKDGLNLVYSGRISQDKNLDFLLDVFSEFLNTGAKANLILLGDGPYMHELMKKIDGQSRVFFSGSLSQQALPALYSGCDIFVFPSTTDTFGMAVLEAQCCGLPAIVSSTGGPKELIKDIATGFIAMSNDKQDWLESIKRLAYLHDNEPSRFAEMKRFAREYAVSRFNWKSVIDDITGVSASEENEKVAALAD
jgi:glycosyltransferase involved in cell wall biosynthesis